MPDPVEHEDGPDEARPSVKELIGQLAEDGRAFARAEIAYLRDQAGERAGHALPGLVMIGAAVALAMGALIATLVGLMFWLAIAIGPGWSVLVVAILSLLAAWLLAQIGIGRIRQSLKLEREP